MSNQNKEKKEADNYLCEGGRFCDHGYDSTHWVGKDELELNKEAQLSILDLSKSIENFNEIENLVSIEEEVSNTKFNYVTLNFQDSEIPDYDLGIEVTNAKFLKDGIENIDPQHGKNPNIETSAIEESLNYDLDKLAENPTIATIRPDADSIGAMAVLELRKSEITLDTELIKMIGKFDSYGYKKAAELYPEIEVRQAEITAASQKCLGRDPIEDKVIWMKKLLTGRAEYSEIKEINNKWNQEKELAKKNLKIEPLIENKAVLITGNHPQAFAIGYEHAGIVAAYNPEFVRPWIKDDKATEKWTIARYSEAEDIDIDKLKKELNIFEKTFSKNDYDPAKTWGGPANLVASPQGYTSNIPKDMILTLIKSCTCPEKEDRLCTCGSGIPWHQCQGIDGDIRYCG